MKFCLPGPKLSDKIIDIFSSTKLSDKIIDKISSTNESSGCESSTFTLAAGNRPKLEPTSVLVFDPFLNRASPSPGAGPSRGHNQDLKVGVRPVKSPKSNSPNEPVFSTDRMLNFRRKLSNLSRPNIFVRAVVFSVVAGVNSSMADAKAQSGLKGREGNETEHDEGIN